jgi:hypothetical protein
MALTRRRLKGSDGEQWLNSTGASGRATNTSMRVVSLNRTVNPGRFFFGVLEALFSVAP